jgi:hypothetical protein
VPDTVAESQIVVSTVESICEEVEPQTEESKAEGNVLLVVGDNSITVIIDSQSESYE